MACHPALAEWEITRFVVYEGKPVKDASDYGALEDALSLPRGWQTAEKANEVKRADPALLEEIGTFLGEVAREYSNMGFADPVATGWLDSIVKDASGNDAIRVYLYDVQGGPRAFYSPGLPCSSPRTHRKVVNINALKFAPAGRIRDIDYATLAHEFFHAVHYASEYQKGSCGRGKWISEGTSDAIAHDVARKVRGLTFKEWLRPRESEMAKIYGGRDYIYPLSDLNPFPTERASEDAAYMTSSFWRYLAELKYARQRNASAPLPSSFPAAGVDYSYLANIFNEPWSYTTTPEGSIRWVNKVLKKEKQIRAGLPLLYSRFISAFADYGETRIAPERKRLGIMRYGEPGPTTNQWLQQIFNDCERAASFPATVKIKLHPNAAGCIEVQRPAGPNLATSAAVIQTVHNDEALLKQLRIGLLDGTLVSAPSIYSFMGNEPPFIARWTFPLFGDSEDIYIVSNMSSAPQRTRPFTPELYFSLSEWSDDMWQGPLPPKPTPPPYPPLPKRDIEKKRLKNVIANPVEHLMPVPKVERKQWRRPCELTDTKYNLCSARMVITLVHAPWTPKDNLLSGEYTVSNIFEGVSGSDSSGTNVMSAQFEAGRKTELFLESVDASKIRIELPKTNYGFTGTYNNASIRVSKAGGGAYLSYGPTVNEGHRNIHRPPNGTITIEEYSHLVLRGAFSAELVDLDNPGQDSSPKVAKSISGSFFIPSPFLLDDDFTLVEDHARAELIQNVMQTAPFGSGAMDSVIESTGGVPPQVLCDKDVDEEFLQAMGFTSGCEDKGSALKQQCSCECDKREQEEEIPECQKTCRREWRQCPLPDHVAAGSLEKQMEYCKQVMLKKGIPEGQIPLLLDQIRQTPEAWRKETMKSLCAEH